MPDRANETIQDNSCRFMGPPSCGAVVLAGRRLQHLGVSGRLEAGRGGILLDDHELHAPVVGAAVQRLVVVDRLLFAVAHGFEPLGRHAALDERSAHGLRATLRELLVELAACLARRCAPRCVPCAARACARAWWRAARARAPSARGSRPCCWRRTASRRSRSWPHRPRRADVLRPGSRRRPRSR